MIAAALAILKALPWRRILPGLGAAAVIGLIWWQVSAHFRYVGDLELKVTEQAEQITERDAKIEAMKAEQTKANAEVEAAEAARAAMVTKYQDLLTRPPAEIVRWRERVVTVPAEITGPTCTDAVLQVHQVLVSERGWPQ